MKKEFLKIVSVFSLVLFSFVLSNTSARAANALDIVINEIAWTGTEASYNDEWIELHNNTDSTISLDGWLLKAADNAPEIILTGTVPVNGFYLLERTNDDTVPNITADQIYTGALGNKGEHLQLFDNQNNLIDEVNCEEGWFTGDNSTKQTMERINPNLTGTVLVNWQTSQNPGGTPRDRNSTSSKVPETRPLEVESPGDEIPENESLRAKPQSTEKLQPSQIVYPSGIVINELLPSPEGPDSEEEWIEIFNQNSFGVDLSGWQIYDTVGRVTTYIFPEGARIKAGEFLSLPRPITKITLNNDGDKITLSHPTNKIADQASFQKAPLGQSYNRTEAGWIWSNSLTPASVNIIPPQIQEKNPDRKTDKDSTILVKKELANAKELLLNSSYSFPAIFVASIVAILSGAIILFLKRKV